MITLIHPGPVKYARHLVQKGPVESVGVQIGTDEVSW